MQTVFRFQGTKFAWEALRFAAMGLTRLHLRGPEQTGTRAPQHTHTHSLQYS